MMKKLLVFLSFLLFLFFPNSVLAQESGWIINSFQSTIAVQPDGIVRISETIAVDFNALQKHGIYRDIPYAYSQTPIESGQKDGGTYYTEIVVSKVLQDNESATYKVFNNGSYIRIQIGDANRTISGKHIYVIAYTAKGILQRFESVDELYWNVAGNGWGVPIESVAANVTIPKGSISQVVCYQGLQGSDTPCFSKKIDEKTANFAVASPLSTSEGITIAVGFTKGVIPILTVEKPKTLFEKLAETFSVVTFVIVLFGGMLWVLTLWYRKGRDIKLAVHETIVVEFTPPENLLPAEMGILMDEKADTLDVTATIIDLTTRGYLTITEIPKKWLFGSMDYELAQTTKSDTDLLSYEKMLLDRIFESSKNKKVSTLKNDFYNDLAKIKADMYDHMMKKGVFVSHPQKTRTNYLLLGIFLLILAIALTIFGSVNSYVLLIDIGVGLIPGSILMLIVSQFMSRRSAKGRELYRRVKGYREFINTAEKYRQRFFEKENMFNEILPYAIVFGLTEKFADAMKEIGLKNPTITGYYGVHAFNAYAFTNSVNTFSNSFSSAAASTPSSSGSGGGGSSGGGFGGGGGGSW